MSEFQPLIDQLYLEEVRRARALGEEGRLLLGIETSEMNLAWAQQIEPGDRARRYRIARTLDEHGCYGAPVPRL